MIATEGYSKKLFKRSRLNLRKFVFGNRVVDYRLLEWVVWQLY